ncbi:transglutaminase-like domain-containing protein [Streptomyces pathocidini]|uniref:transglutaminase-like domain-containing protein n=1 Tax=Streptomyces pathocidini TaxID=1650571 RepID=UPI0033D64AD4
MDDVHARRRRFAAEARAERPDLALLCLLLAGEAEPDLGEAGLDAAQIELDRLAGLLPYRPADGARGWARAVADLLGDRCGFHGVPADYRRLESSLLPDVLRRRRGLPILLSVVWMEVARRAGAPVHGVALPGHFVVGFGDPEAYGRGPGADGPGLEADGRGPGADGPGLEADGRELGADSHRPGGGDLGPGAGSEAAPEAYGREAAETYGQGAAGTYGRPVLVDPFDRGRVLTDSDADLLVVGATGAPLDPSMLRPADPRDIVLRILNNIRAWAAARPERSDVALWAVDLSLLLPSHPARLRYDRAQLLVQRGDFATGAAEMEAYAEVVAAVDEEAAESLHQQAFAARALLN